MWHRVKSPNTKRFIAFVLVLATVWLSPSPWGIVLGTSHVGVGTVVVEKDDGQHIDNEKLATYGAVVDEGSSVVEGHHDWLEKALSGLSDTDPALKSFTAGSNGPVREITLNHAMIRRSIDVVSPLNAFGEGEDVIGILAYELSRGPTSVLLRDYRRRHTKHAREHPHRICRHP